MWSDVRAESLCCNQLDPTFQDIFKQKRNFHEIVKSVFFRDEFHENIYVALGCLITPDKGTEQANIFKAIKCEFFSFA